MNQLNCNEFALQRVPEITRRHPLGLPPSIVACEVYQKRSQMHGRPKSFPLLRHYAYGKTVVDFSSRQALSGC